MFVLTFEGKLKKYPYSLGDLRRDNPSISFPAEPSLELLAQFGVYPVTLTDKPKSGERNHRINEIDPKLVDGNWVQQFDVSVIPEDKAKNKEGAAVRMMRNKLLSDCDWTQLPDAPVNVEDWRTYRQKLRDVTDQEGYPFTISWPIPPAS